MCIGLTIAATVLTMIVFLFVKNKTPVPWILAGGGGTCLVLVIIRLDPGKMLRELVIWKYMRGFTFSRFKK